MFKVVTKKELERLQHKKDSYHDAAILTLYHNGYRLPVVVYNALPSRVVAELIPLSLDNARYALTVSDGGINFHISEVFFIGHSDDAERYLSYMKNECQPSIYLISKTNGNTHGWHVPFVNDEGKYDLCQPFTGDTPHLVNLNMVDIPQETFAEEV